MPVPGFQNDFQHIGNMRLPWDCVAGKYHMLLGQKTG